MKDARKFEDEEGLGHPIDQNMCNCAKPVRDENEASKVRQILKSGGARFLVYFGQFVVEVFLAVRR